MPTKPRGRLRQRSRATVVIVAAIAWLSFTATAAAVNRPPLLDELTNVRVGADPLGVAAFVPETKTFDAFASDADGDTPTYSLPLLIDPNGSSVALSELGASIVNTVDGSGRPVGRVTLEPGAEDEGVWQLRVRADDGQGGSDEHNIFISVGTFTNRSPAFSTSPPKEVFASEGEAISFSMTADDPNSGQLVTLTITGQPSGSSFTSGTGNPISRTFSWTPTTGQSGDYTIFFDARDDGSPNITERIRTIIHVLRTCADSGAITDTNDDHVIDATDGVTSGDDFIKGDTDPETINAGDGNDFVCAGDGNDTLNGGTGDDQLFGEGGNDGFNPGVDDPGADDYDGGTGGDRVFYNADGSSVDNSVTPGDGASDDGSSGEGDDVKDSTEHVDFGPGDDSFSDPTVGADNTVRGGDGADSVEGGAGKDLLLGQGGDDTDLDGQGDNDKVNGGAGNDGSIEGGLGADQLYGESGDDTLEGYGYYGIAVDGNDLVYGGTGADTLRGDEGNDRLYGDAGGDGVDGGEGHDAVFGGADADGLIGGGGNDSLVPGPDIAADTMQGDGGTDTASYTNDSDDIYASIGDGANDGSDPDGPLGPLDGTLEGDDIGSDVENVSTGPGDDTVIGDPDPNRLQGNAGEDTIEGGDGRDVLIGNTDNDFLIGNDDGGTPQADSLQCDGDDGNAPRDRYLRDSIDGISQCETDAAPPI